MTAIITVANVNAWLDTKKASISSLDDELAAQLTTRVFGAVSSRYSTENWVSNAYTPQLILEVISMLYAGYHFHKVYSTDTEPGMYGELLLRDANLLLDSIVNGNLSLASSGAIPVVPLTTGTAEIADELVLAEPKFSMDAEF